MSLPSPTPPSPARSNKIENLLVAALLLVIGWSYYFAIPTEFRHFRSKHPDGYYGLQTEAFHSGQLHLKIATDPKLLTLENPYAGPQGANRPHDMSFYRGRFYLYYGATPILILYLPWRIITGGHLGESLGMVMMLYGGLVLAAAWLVSARRRWFPQLSFGWVLLLVGAMGFGPPLFPSATNNTFYGVPIACAYFCLMVAFTGANRALAATTPGSKAAWLAAASLAWGLAVGARPIYVLGLMALTVPAAYLWRTSGRDIRWRSAGTRLLAATVVPAALVGLALMTYNYLRFDSPFDFGIRFSMASGDVREARFMGLEFIGKNLSLYLLTAVSFSRYFPFIIVDANSWGMLPHLPLAALGALFPLTLLHRPLRESRWFMPGVMLAGAGLANFCLLCLFFGGEERYMLDFTPPWMLLAATTALALLDQARHRSRPGAMVTARLVVGGLIAYTLATGLMLTLGRHAYTGHQLWLERALNTPTHLLERWSGTRHGPVELEVMFPRDRVGATEPLLTTGLGENSGDGIMVHYLDGKHIQFSAFHLGRGGPVSEPIEIDYGVPHRLHLALGSLCPPIGHPLFADWPASQSARLRRRLRVDLDGHTVLQGNFMVHPSVPSGLLVGRSNLPDDVSAPQFTGRIVHQQRPGIDRAAAAGFETDAGPVRLTLRFPARVGDEGLPLITTGSPRDGDMVFARLQSDGQIRFGHDSFKAGAIVSAPMPCDPAVDHVVEVEMGSLYPPDIPDIPSFARNRLRVALDGKVVIDTSRHFNPSKTEEVEFGFNTIGASTAIEYFPGAIRKIERIAPAPSEASLQKWGYLRLSVALPPAPAAVAEPLVVTGTTGRADVLFVRYEQNGLVRLGVDHWGVGVALSDPLALSSDQPCLLEVLSGGLLPPKSDPAWRGRDEAEVEQLRNRFEVRVNGKTVLRPDFTPFPIEAGETAIGRNAIGASTCEPHFTGRLLLIQRLPW